jgi:Family of unknown function (DUF6454)
MAQRLIQPGQGCKMRGFWISGCAAALALSIPAVAQRNELQAALVERVRTLTRESRWTQVAAVPVAFRTHHPQGMVKIGEALFVSSVEIKVRTRRLAQPIDGYDRDVGEGAGHLFKMDMTGNLLEHVLLGEGTMYHPGGIDYDGRHIWVSVAEYRPNSRSIVYRLDPATLKAVEVFRFADHLGAVVRNTDDNTLHGVSWGSRRFYRWALDASGNVPNAAAVPDRLQTLNSSHYVDYQDCKYVGARRMLCTGVTELRQPAATAVFRLGGLDMINLEDGRPEHQVPVLLWTSSGLAMTQNPVWIEPSGTGLRAYFMPEDDTSTLYVYESR